MEEEQWQFQQIEDDSCGEIAELERVSNHWDAWL